MLNYMATMFLLSGEVPERMGNAHFVHVPYNSFKTSTNYIIIACIGDAFFEKFAELLGRSELRDPKYLKQPVRFADKDYIESIINEELVKHDADYWLARLRTARIPCGPVNDLAQALSDPQVRARNMVVDVQLPSGSVVAMPGNPVKISGCDDPAQPSPPPRLGEHSEAVLSDLLKYPVERIAALRNAGIVQ